MSLKDRLKKKKAENIKKQDNIKQEKSPEKSLARSLNLLNIQETICSILHKKISATPKWYDYSEKKQESLATEFVSEQLSLNFPTLRLNNETISDLIREIILTTKDFGILESLLKDDDINYIMVNGADSIYVEKNNKLLKANISFKNGKDLKRFVDNIASSMGHTINERKPVLDAYHRRGYHINILIPPATSKDPCITIKKINTKLCDLKDLLKQKSISLEMAKMLETAVLSRTNIVVAGLKESGKTTVLNALCNKIPQTERAILIEDIEELNIKQKNVLRLKTQPLDNNKDTYQITPLNLIKNSIRMRPDRIILGECTGDETYEFIKAMETGYLGLMTTVYASSASDALNRLESLILSYSKLSSNVIQEELLNSIGLIVYVHRMPTGERRVVRISEPIELDDGTISTQDIFVYQKQIENNKIIWEHISTGIVPKFVTQAMEKGFKVNDFIFDKKYTHTYPED